MFQKKKKNWFDCKNIAERGPIESLTVVQDFPSGWTDGFDKKKIEV